MPKIPDPGVLADIEKYFATHHCWHLQRYKGANWVDHSPTVLYEGEPGSGKQFLEFHHELLRTFSWILQQHKYAPPAWEATLPAPMEALFAHQPAYIPAVYAGLRERVAAHDVDALGIFIERRNPALKGSGIHDNMHHYLGALEGGAARGFTMAKMSEALRNEYFWSLHFWLDHFYVACVGDVLSTPLPPDQMLLMPKTCEAHH